MVAGERNGSPSEYAKSIKLAQSAISKQESILSRKFPSSFADDLQVFVLANEPSPGAGTIEFFCSPTPSQCLCVAKKSSGRVNLIFRFAHPATLPHILSQTCEVAKPYHSVELKFFVRAHLL